MSLAPWSSITCMLSLEGQYDHQLEETFVRDCGTTVMTLPVIGDWVAVLVTAVVSATRFFVQLPLGNRNPFSYSRTDHDPAEGTCYKCFLTYLWPWVHGTHIGRISVNSMRSMLIVC